MLSPDGCSFSNVPEPKNGSKRIKVSRTVPDEVQLTCNDGYILRGSPHRQCIDGQWTGTNPRCVGKYWMVNERKGSWMKWNGAIK